MLRSLSGRRHSVLTAVSMAYSRLGTIHTEIETTQVWFAELDEQMIHWYVATGEPMDKAGGYGIQDRGSVLVTRIRGCYHNVVGLPVRRMIAMMERIGQGPGVTTIKSNHLPWRLMETAGGRNGTPDQPDEGHPQGTTPV
jgi:predicted house-cleaning NTP pyrophosphatase (Maf/HAM1 superfamily)